MKENTSRLKRGRVIAIVIVASMLFSLTAALGATGRTEEVTPDITLDVITYYGGRDLLELLNETIELFEAENPHVTIDHTGFTSSLELGQVVKLAFDSGEGQDIVMVDDMTQRLLARYDYLLDITGDVIERGWLERTTPGVIDLYAMMHPDTYYSLPSILSLICLYYNKEILDELGVKPPESVEELNDIMYKAKDAGYVPIELAGTDVYGLLWIADSIVKTSVPIEHFFKQYTLEETTPEFSDAYLGGLELIDQWRRDGLFRQNILSISRGDIPTLYAEGNSVFVVSGLWDLNNMEDTNVPTGAVAFPRMDSSLPHYVVSQPFGAWALNAELDLKPAEKEAALDFLDFLISPEISLMWFERTAYLPAAEIDTAAADVSPLKKEVMEAAENVYMGGFLENAVPGVLSVANDAVQLMIMGEVTPDEAWDMYLTEFNNLKDQYKE